MTGEIQKGGKPGCVEAVAVVRTSWRKRIGNVLHRGEEHGVDVDSGTTAVLGVNESRKTRGWIPLRDVDLGDFRPPVITEAQAEQEYGDFTQEGQTRREAVYGTSKTRHDVDAMTRKRGGDPNYRIPKVVLPNEDPTAKVPKKSRFRP